MSASTQTAAYYSLPTDNDTTGPKMGQDGTASGPISPPSSFVTSASSDSQSSLNQVSASPSCSSSSSSSTCSNSNAGLVVTTTSSNTGDGCSRVPPNMCLSLHSLEPKPFKPFKSSSEYIEAMKEDLAEWLNRLYTDLDLTPENFFERLETGAIVCRHANNVTKMGRKLQQDQNENENDEDDRIRDLCDNVSRKLSMQQTPRPTPRPRTRQMSCQPSNGFGLSMSASKSYSSLSMAQNRHAASLTMSQPRPTKNQSSKTIDWRLINLINYKQSARAGTFFARDNICQFIGWTRSLNILECLLFETDDLVARKNERSFILCLLEVARIGFRVGMPTPLIIQLEQEIDREIERDSYDNDTDTITGATSNQCDTDDGYCDLQQDNDDDLSAKRVAAKAPIGSRIPTRQHQQTTALDEDDEEDEDEYLDYGPKPQIITNDLLSLHERVVQLLCQCTCPTQFPMVRVGDNGKYKVGDKLIIFVRILRRHIMVRVGGGWQELSEFLRAKDPCRTKDGRCSQQSMASMPSSTTGSHHNGSQGSPSDQLASPSSPSGGLVVGGSLASMTSSSSCLLSSLAPTSTASVTMIPTPNHTTPARPTLSHAAPATPSQSLLRPISTRSRLTDCPAHVIHSASANKSTTNRMSSHRQQSSYRNFGSISSSASMSWLANN